jgi:hypothetical protein
VAATAASSADSTLSSTSSASSAHAAELGGSSNVEASGSVISDAGLSEAQRAEALALAAAGFGGEATQFSVANQ